MRSILCLTLAMATLPLTAQAASSTPAEVLAHFGPCQIDGTTTNNLPALIGPWVGVRVRAYTPPTSATMTKVSALFEALDDHDISAIDSTKDALNMSTCRVNGSDVLVFHAPVNEQRFVFLWRVGAVKVPGDATSYGNPVDPLILEAPHEGSDMTYRVSTQMMMQTRARVLLTNTVHKETSSSVANCQSPHKISDGAHSVTTIVHKTHAILARLYPESFVLQLHGMDGGEMSHMLLTNNFNSAFTTKHKSGARLFALSIPEVFPEDPLPPSPANPRGIKYGKFSVCSDFAIGPTGPLLFRRPTGCMNRNVQAHQLNGGDQCDKGTEDMGRFLHLELHLSFRDGDAAATKKVDDLSETLNRAMNKWTRNLDPEWE